jgi:hypothetical protein
MFSPATLADKQLSFAPGMPSAQTAPLTSLLDAHHPNVDGQPLSVPEVQKCSDLIFWSIFALSKSFTFMKQLNLIYSTAKLLNAWKTTSYS